MLLPLGCVKGQHMLLTADHFTSHALRGPRAPPLYLWSPCKAVHKHPWAAVASGRRGHERRLGGRHLHKQFTLVYRL